MSIVKRLPWAFYSQPLLLAPTLTPTHMSNGHLRPIPLFNVSLGAPIPTSLTAEIPCWNRIYSYLVPRHAVTPSPILLRLLILYSFLPCNVLSLAFPDHSSLFRLLSFHAQHAFENKIGL